MPAHSPELPGGPAPDSVFAASGDLGTEISAIAHGDAYNMETGHHIDPDQVEGAVAKKRLGVAFWIALSIFVVIALAALLAPVLPLKSYTATLGRPKQAPNAEFWFGTDALGRDIFSRVIWGGRVSIVVGFMSIFLGLVIGGTIGLAAGYFRGRVETVLMGAMDVLLSFPALLLALAIVSFSTSRTLTIISVAIGVVSIAPIARLVRANTLTYADREFVVAARSLGASNIRIVRREILPNVIPPVASYAIILIAVAIVGEGVLAFLGLSVAPPTPTWGGMAYDGKPQIETAPWISLIPSAAIFVVALCLNLAGDRLREFFDIRDGAL